ncbi:MAG: TonB-dependent siderophore receptor [Puniceicoccaceae bacterium]
MKTTETRKFLTMLSALLALLVWMPVGFAQSTTSDDDEEDGQVFDMSPFRVDASSDDGYVATNAISGTRLNTSIKELPMPLEVITSEFMDHIGAIDVREGLAYSSGVVLDTDFDMGLSNRNTANGTRSFDFSPSGSGGRVSEDQFKIRGLTTNVQLRQGFITQGTLDSSDIGRVEVVRGPAALLYGHSILGGVINVIPRYPLSEPRYRATFALDSEGLVRSTFDATGPLFKLGEDTLNYRITMAGEKRNDWRDWQSREKFFIAPKLEFKPWKGANVYIDMQFQDSTREGNGDLDVGTNQRNEYNEYKDVARDYFGRPETHNWSGKDHKTDSDDFLGMVEFRQNITDWLTFLAAVQEQTVDQDRFLLRNIGLVTNDDAVPESVRRPSLYGDGYQAIRFRYGADPAEIEFSSNRLELAGRWEDVDLGFLGNTAHSLVVGRQKTKQTNESTDRSDSDWLYHAIDDFSPFEFEGSYDPVTYQDRLDERWQTGYYAVYQGSFFNNKINLVGGIRRDEYMVRTRKYDYTDGVRREEPRGSLETDSSNHQREWNTGPWAVEQGLPGSRSSDAPVREGYRFGGNTQTEESPTLGVTYNLNDSFSIYALTAAGLVPNPGQRDGYGNNFGAEKTQSKEIGIKFDLMKDGEGRRILSGTISAFQIERENAIWFYSFAPSPRKNVGVERADQPDRGGFDPRLPRSFSVHRDVFAHLGQPGYLPERPPTTLAQLDDMNAGGSRHPATNEGQEWVVVNYENFDQNPIERQAVEATLEGFPLLDGSLMIGDYFSGPNSNRANWTGNSRGTDVSFNDESEGIDLQLVFSPIKNWQMTFNYAYLERVVTKGFQLVDFVDLRDGINYGTEYDLWVSRFGGAENFEDPLRASTGSGDMLLGLSLDDSPKHSFSLWSNYRFESGSLEGLSLRGGVSYTGERQSTVAIGGGNTASNAFPTPDFAEMIMVQLGLGYTWEMGDTRWRINANIYNLFDHTMDITYSDFVDELGNDIQRRSRAYYAPRTVRISASVDF